MLSNEVLKMAQEALPGRLWSIENEQILHWFKGHIYVVHKKEGAVLFASYVTLGKTNCTTAPEGLTKLANKNISLSFAHNGWAISKQVDTSEDIKAFFDAAPQIVEDVWHK